ncbi:MAG: DUF3189 family protein [Bacillota bacterium]|jgi:hypothetical protein
MRIIFYGYSGVHSAVLAAATHLGIISLSEAASLQLSEVPFFGTQKVKYHLRLHGPDIWGNEIYSLGVGREIKLLPRAIIDFLRLYQNNNQKIKLINTIAPLSYIVKAGELLSCIGCLKWGNYLVSKGIKADYIKLVAHVNRELANNDGGLYLNH